MPRENRQSECYGKSYDEEPKGVTARIGYKTLLDGPPINIGICLAGSVLDNLQGFGLGQKEQLFEEFGGGPELLAASL
jgi:hypothetical protein